MDVTKQAKSAGARYERKCILAMVRRLEDSLVPLRDTEMVALKVISKVIMYVLTRQKRYDPKPGGLGRK